MHSSASQASPTFDDALRDDLLPLVLQHLPLEDLCRVQRVCRRLRDAVAAAQGVWQRLYERTWPQEYAAGVSNPQGMQAQTQQTQQQQRQQQQPQQRHHQQQPLPLESQVQGRSSGLTAQPQHLTSLPPPQQQVQHRQHADAGSESRSPGAISSSLPPAGSKRKRGAKPDTRATAAAAAPADARAGGGSGVNWRELFKAMHVAQARLEQFKRQARRLKAESALQVLQYEVHRLEQALAEEQRLLPALQAELAAVQRARQQAATAALAQTYWQPVAVQRAHGVVTDQSAQDAEAREHDLQQRLAVSRLEARKLQASLSAARRRAAEAARKLQALLP